MKVSHPQRFGDVQVAWDPGCPLWGALPWPRREPHGSTCHEPAGCAPRTNADPSVCPCGPFPGKRGHGRLCHGLTPQHEEGSGSQHRAASRGREGESSRSTDRQHEARTDPLLPLATVSNPNQRVRFIAFCLPFDSRRRLPQFEGCRDSELNPARTWGGRFPEEHGTAQTGRHVAHSVYSAPAGPGALAEHGERYPNFILHFV